MPERPSLRSVRVPGRTDTWLYPPIGRMPFERICMMPEDEINAAVKFRHGLTALLLPKKYEENPKDSVQVRERIARRRLEVKRAAFMLLEGFSASGREFEQWCYSLDSLRETTMAPALSMNSTLDQNLTKKCRRRIAIVREQLAREAALLAPSPELQRLERAIQKELARRGIEPLKIAEIINGKRMPPHARTTPRIQIDVQRMLQIFLYQIEHSTNPIELAAARFGMSANSFEVQKDNYLSPRARAILKELRRE